MTNFVCPGCGAVLCTEDEQLHKHRCSLHFEEPPIEGVKITVYGGARRGGKTKAFEAFQVKNVLTMAQESLCPEAYESFVIAYNQLIENRHLDLEAIDEPLTSLVQGFTGEGMQS